MKKGTKKCMNCGKYGLGYAEFFPDDFKIYNWSVLCPSCANRFASDKDEDE